MHRSPQGRRWRSVPWRATLGVVAVSVFSLPPVAAAALQGEGRAGGKPPPLVNPLTLDIQGQRIAPDNCRFTSALELAPGQPAVREDVIAVDDATCTMRVQRGVPADLAEPAPEPGTSQQSGRAVAQERFAFARTRALATHSHGYHKSYYEDPVQLDVNSVRNDVDWYWNGSWVSSASCSYHYGWLSGSGWGLKENNFFCRYENSQTQVRSSSYAHFKNGIFCAFIDTHTYYDRNNAYGKYNGYLVGTVSASKSGGCTALLSFHHLLRRTLN
jgi:hypothetical protein